MLHVLLIVMFVSVYLRDEFAGPALRGHLTGVQPWQVATWSVGSMFVIALMVHVFIAIQGRRLDRTGRFRCVRRSEDALIVSRIAATLVHVFNILALGWLDTIRAAMGDLVALDELAACFPGLIVFVMGWWSFYPIDRRLRESVIVNELDHGRPLPPMPGRWMFVMGGVRHQMSIILAPIVCILIWGEVLDRVSGWMGHPPWLDSAPARFVGTVIILILMPAILRRVWDTVALGPGPLRDRLVSMCAFQGVRVQELLIWRTHGTMINGAVMGLVSPLRYILLTDALIENLPPHQVEAVTAHELGHVRRRHILLLAAAAIGSIVTVSLAIEVGIGLAAERWVNSLAAQSLIGVLSLSSGVAIFGYVSRRFEWQADAFAVQHLSGHRPGARGVALTSDAVGAMSGALDSVAALNHIPKHRFTWRHGSIATRQKRLAALVGLPAERLPIDRQAMLLSWAAALAGLAAAGLMVWASVSSPPRPASRLERFRAGQEHGGCWCDLSRCTESGTTTSIWMHTPTRS